MGALLLCGAVLAQGERTLEPIAPQSRSSEVRPEWYVGTAKPRFLNWNSTSTYAVLNEPLMFRFTYSSPSVIRAIRFTPIAGGSSLRVNLNAANVSRNNRGIAGSDQVLDVSFTVNASDFAVSAPKEQLYRVALVDAQGLEGEPIQTVINFRSKSDFRIDPAVARASETLSSVVPIGYFQAQSGSSSFVSSVQNFQSYSRLWFEIRLPSSFDLSLNVNLFRTAVGMGVVTLSDDVGQRYAVAWDDRATSGLPDGNGFRFALVMTPKLSPSAKRLILVQAPIKAENLPPELRLEDILEPFRSGLTSILPLLR